MFGTAVTSGHPGVPWSHEQDELPFKSPADPSAGIYSSGVSGSHRDSDIISRPDEVKVSHTMFNEGLG